MSDATTTPDLATAIDDLTEQLRELVEASVHQIPLRLADEGDDLAQAFAYEMVARARYDEDAIAVWSAYLDAIRAARG
jgi:hypothetical protein